MTCRSGAEGALKAEVARVMPDWHVSFSRPGFLTFKHTGERPLDERQLAERTWTFAHAHGLSLGRVQGESLALLAQQVWQNSAVIELLDAQPLADIHVWQREPAATGEDGMDSIVTPLTEEIERAVRAAAPGERVGLHTIPQEHRGPTPRQKLVLDVIVVEPGEWWIGYHRAVTVLERWPGGMIPVSMPSHAVSRAYAKLEEALAWSALPLAAEDECVEIGCAPGGACQALLDRGLFVTGVDPAQVDAAVLEHPRFRHLRKRASEVQRKEFVGVRWLTADMNIAPQAMLDAVESIVTHPGLTIRGLVLTLKLSEWQEAERLPAIAARVRSWGFRDVRLRHLTTGGQEVCLVALRRKALRRMGKPKLDRKRVASRPRTSASSVESKPAVQQSRRRKDKAHESPAGPHF